MFRIPAVLAILATTNTVFAEAAIRLAVVPDAIVADGPRSAARSDSGITVDRHAIRLGDILGLHLVMSNEADVPSAPVFRGLTEQCQTFQVLVVRPDGTEDLVPSLDGRKRCLPPNPRALRPGESHSLMFFLYRDEPTLDLSEQYVFRQPGTYKIFVRYLHQPLGSEERARAAGQAIDPPLESNQVTIDVGPPIEGWDQLRDAGIILAVKAGDWPEDSKARWSNEERKTLVQQANRAWLAEWHRAVLERRREGQ